jgi:hypothetical protein
MLKNSKGKSGKGQVFGTLLRFVGDSYYARMELFQSKQVLCVRDIDTAAVSPSRPDLEISLGDDGIEDGEIPEPERNEGGEEIHPDTSKEGDTDLREVDHGIGCQGAANLKYKPRAVSLPACIHVPLEIDPFSTYTPAVMEKCLEKWNAVWSKFRFKWRTSVYVRGNRVNTDRFWHPPFTCTSKRIIRSKKDLFTYLDFASSEKRLQEETWEIFFNRTLTRWASDRL